jgi:hypothetical protein
MGHGLPFGLGRTVADRHRADKGRLAAFGSGTDRAWVAGHHWPPIGLPSEPDREPGQERPFRPAIVCARAAVIRGPGARSGMDCQDEASKRANARHRATSAVRVEFIDPLAALIPSRAVIQLNAAGRPHGTTRSSRLYPAGTYRRNRKPSPSSASRCRGSRLRWPGCAGDAPLPVPAVIVSPPNPARYPPKWRFAPRISPRRSPSARTVSLQSPVLRC